MILFFLIMKFSVTNSFNSRRDCDAAVCMRTFTSALTIIGGELIFAFVPVFRVVVWTRVAIRPVFPGHVLFFRVKNSVRPDFLNLVKCPGFWIINCLSLFPTKSMLPWSFWCFGFYVWQQRVSRLAISQCILFKNLVKSC